MKRRSLFGALAGLLGLGGAAALAKPSAEPDIVRLEGWTGELKCSNVSASGVYFGEQACLECGEYTLIAPPDLCRDVYICDTCGAENTASDLLLAQPVGRITYCEPGPFTRYSGYDPLEPSQRGYERFLGQEAVPDLVQYNKELIARLKRLGEGRIRIIDDL